MKYSIQKIASILGIKNQHLLEGEITQLLTDSRKLNYPQETLFFAIETRQNDAHKFIADLYGSGVRNFVVTKILPEWKSFTDANFLKVGNTLHALQRVAAYHRKQFDIPVIGITGSNGKTVVKEWLYQLLEEDYNIVRSPRSYNSQTGVPLSVWELNQNATLAI
jgi:UDP-N-acetylmuramyl pentapeptide synthase